MPNVMRTRWLVKSKPPTGRHIAMQKQSPRVWSNVGRDHRGRRMGRTRCPTAFLRDTFDQTVVASCLDLAQSPNVANCLIDESIALLPGIATLGRPRSVPTTRTAPESRVRVRCVLAGSEEAKLAPLANRDLNLTTRTNSRRHAC